VYKSFKKGANIMMIAYMSVTLYAPWVHSLKEKRMEVKSLLARVRSKFNVSAAEADAQDFHQTIVLSFAALAANAAQADGIMDRILQFLEENTQAEATRVRREIR
jgi:uncharacterized protein YlxP (DUF503 family)